MYLTADLKIWHEGLDSWTEINDVSELKDLLKSKSKQTPPPFVKSSPPPFSSPKPQNTNRFNSFEKNTLFKNYKNNFILLMVMSLVGIIYTSLLIDEGYKNYDYREAMPFYLVWFIASLLSCIMFYFYSEKKVPKIISWLPTILIVCAVLVVLFVHYTWDYDRFHYDRGYITSTIIIIISVFIIIPYVISFLTNKKKNASV